MWANIIPCIEGQNSPQDFWCGTPEEEECSTTNGTVITIIPGNVQRVLSTSTSSAVTTLTAQLITTSPSAGTLQSSANPSTGGSNLPSQHQHTREPHRCLAIFERTSSTDQAGGTDATQQAGSDRAADTICHNNDAKVAAVRTGIGIPLLLYALSILE